MSERKRGAKPPTQVERKLYTTEASESKKKSDEESSLPDPPKAEAEKAIAEFIISEDEGYHD